MGMGIEMPSPRQPSQFNLMSSIVSGIFFHFRSTVMSYTGLRKQAGKMSAGG